MDGRAIAHACLCGLTSVSSAFTCAWYVPEVLHPHLQDAALAFCQEHALDKGIAGPLARHIQGNLDRARQDALAQVSSAATL